MKSESWKLIRRTEQNPIPEGMYAFEYTALGGDIYKCLYFCDSKVYLLFLPDVPIFKTKDWQRVLDKASDCEREAYLSWPRPAGYYARVLQH